MVNTVLLLPGLDGTGHLSNAFTAALASHIPVRTIRYPTDVPMGYDDLLALIRRQLPDGDFAVIGESFSGPLALRLAREEPEKVKAVILGASFARLDLPAKRLLTRLVEMFSPRLVPEGILSSMLMGKSATPELRAQLRAALASVAPDVLRARAIAAMEVDLLGPEHQIRQSILYLRATSDRLIPRTTGTSLAAMTPRLHIQDVASPHFLFQTAPEACTQAVLRFLRELDATPAR